jgi:hypothetical protein
MRRRIIIILNKKEIQKVKKDLDPLYEFIVHP